MTKLSIARVVRTNFSVAFLGRISRSHFSVAFLGQSLMVQTIAISEKITLKYLRDHFNLQRTSEVDFFSEVLRTINAMILIGIVCRMT
jgi:hypothetical protein